MKQSVIRFKAFFTLLLAFSFTATLFAENSKPLPSNGGTLGKQLVEELNSSGVLKLNGTTIQKLSVQGSLVATEANLGYLHVIGEANLRGTHVSESSAIFGYLRAQDTSFDGPLVLGAHKAVFTSSKLNSITVRIENGFKAKQIIELKQGTIVDGPITFESGKGEVHSYGSQTLGPIIGGKLIKK